MKAPLQSVNRLDRLEEFERVNFGNERYNKSTECIPALSLLDK